MIKRYTFGLMDIDGKEYDHDVMVFWTGEVVKWQRPDGHFAGLEDLASALEREPDVVVVGNGDMGIVKIEPDLEKELRLKGMKLIVKKTKEAAETFNEIAKQGRRVVGLFHLTC